MKNRNSRIFRRFLSGVLCLTILLLPFSGAHIHLAEAHHTGESHNHATEVHMFHIQNAHDSIYVVENHSSDATQVELGEEGFIIILAKIVKSLSAFLLLLIFVPPVLASGQLFTFRLFPYLDRFIFFRGLVRGPPFSHL